MLVVLTRGVNLKANRALMSSRRVGTTFVQLVLLHARGFPKANAQFHPFAIVRIVSVGVFARVVVRGTGRRFAATGMRLTRDGRDANSRSAASGHNIIPHYLGVRSRMRGDEVARQDDVLVPPDLVEDEVA